MKNYVQEGNTITVTAPATVTSGQLVVVGSINGVAAFDAASGADVEVTVEGVFELPKVTTTWSHRATGCIGIPGRRSSPRPPAPAASPWWASPRLRPGTASPR